MISKEIIHDLLESTIAADHDGLDWYELEVKSSEYNIVLVTVNEREYTSGSGKHYLLVNTPPVLTMGGRDFYVGRPAFSVFICAGKFRVKIYNEKLIDDEVLKFLKGLKDMDAWTSGYSIPDGIFRVTGIPTMEWFYKGRRVEAFYMVVPDTERQDAEWFSDWLNQSLIHYIAETL